MPTRAAGSLDLARFDAVLHAYLEDLRRRRYSPSSQSQARKHLPEFFAFLRTSRVRSLAAVTEEHVFSYARHLARREAARGGRLSTWTQRSYLQLVERLFAFLDRRGLLLRNPALDLVKPRASKLPRRVLTETEARRLLAAPPSITAVGKRDRAVMELLYGAGLRASECARAELRDLDLAKGTLFVRLGKGRKDRMVPVGGRAALALDVYLREARPEHVRDARQQRLFLSVYGKPLTVGTLESIVTTAARAARIAGPVSPHVLRHSCGTHLLQGGADVRQVQALLGHASIATTAIYTRVLPKDVQAATRKAHPRERTWRRRQKRGKRR